MHEPMNKILAWLNGTFPDGSLVLTKLVFLIRKNQGRMEPSSLLNTNEAIALAQLGQFLMGMAVGLGVEGQVEELLRQQVTGKRITIVTADEAKEMGL